MKKLLPLVLLLLIALSCKNGGNAGSNYLKEPVGSIKNGKFTITNLADIKEQWQAAAGQESTAGMPESFEIVQGTTQGDVQQDYHILVSKNKDGSVKTAALLSLKGNKFYFEKQQGAESMIYFKVICSGSCPTGCNPVVRITGNSKFLVCTPCADCIKAEGEMR